MKVNKYVNKHLVDKKRIENVGGNNYFQKEQAGDGERKRNMT